MTWKRRQPGLVHFPGDYAHADKCETCKAYFMAVKVKEQTFQQWFAEYDCPRCGDPLINSTTCHMAGMLPKVKGVSHA